MSSPTKRERIDALYLALSQGTDSGARCRLIEECLRPVAGVVREFVARRPQFSRHYDDLVGEAHIRLIEVIDAFRAPHKPVNNPRSLILKAVDRALHEYCDEAILVGPTSRTTRNHGERKPVSIDSLDSAPIPEDCNSAAEILNTVRECCHTDVERDIITLRLRGLTDSAIAAELDLSQPTVTRARARVEARYDEQTSIGA